MYSPLLLFLLQCEFKQKNKKKCGGKENCTLYNLKGANKNKL